MLSKILYTSLIILLVLFCGGCIETPKEKTIRIKNHTLPKNSYDVKSLDNCWFSFKLKIDEKEHSFLIHTQQNLLLELNNGK